MCPVHSVRLQVYGSEKIIGYMSKNLCSMCIQCCPSEIVQPSFIMEFSATKCLTLLPSLNCWVLFVFKIHSVE